MATVRIYRITHRKYADAPYSGKGGLYAAGRWHHQGHLVTYASESLALATLEQLGRARAMQRLKEMVYAPAALDPAVVIRPRESNLPEDWDRRPPGTASQDYGDRWWQTQMSAALRVPSVILPEGYNYVLNPTHPDFGDAIRVLGEARPLQLDPRLTERLRLRHA